MRRIGVVVCALLISMTADVSAHHDGFRGRTLYYSDEYAGDAMACGPKYQPWKMVAAHRSLPCGTELRVRNTANGNVVTVTVQDRGPYTDGFVLDVSRRAATKLGFVHAGSAEIRAIIKH
jgi:rare lipoprotein A